MTSYGHGYQAVRVGLRAPRVALIIDGDDGWESAAAMALFTAGRTWGGAGFVVVPHHGGTVNPALLRMIGFYDPDYVLTLQYSIREFEASFPGRLRNRSDGQMLTGPALLESLGDRADSERWPDFAASGARESILEACSAYRRRLDNKDTDWDEPLLGVHHEDLGGALVPISSFPKLEGPRLAVPDDVGGAAGLLAAMRCGFRARPELPFVSNGDRSGLTEIIRYGLGRPDAGQAPQSLCMFEDGRASTMSTTNAATSWDPTRTGLIPVGPFLRERDQTLVVFGDTSDDFALALAWDRMFGNGVWIPDAWMANDGPERQAIHEVMVDRVTRAVGRHQKIQGTSVSLPAEKIDTYLASLRNGGIMLYGSATEGEYKTRRDNAVTRVDPHAVPFQGAGHLACADQFVLPFSLPATTDDEGTVSLAAPVPDVVPAGPDLQSVRDLEWQIDVSFRPSQMPTGRGLSGRHLTAGDDPWWEWVRSGRDGISYSSQSEGFIPVGATRSQQLARPQLRSLGLQAWVQAKLVDQHMTARLSPSGVRVDILRRLWGDRASLAADLTESLRPLFLAFRATSKKSAEAYPEKDGVVLNAERLEGYLTYAAALRVLAGLDDAVVRSELDRLLTLGVLRRGLILGCAQCDHLQFVSIDDLAQTNICGRCRAANQLIQPRWRHPAHEPTWFYELHPAVHDLLQQDGDVPLMAAHHLKKGVRRFSAASELELFTAGTSKPTSEIDLIAAADDILIIGEAKRTSRLGTRKERTKIVRKLVDAAQRVRADQVLLCGANNGPWPQNDIDELRGAMAARTWATGTPPAIRVITGLGAQIQDRLSPKDGPEDGAP